MKMNIRKAKKKKKHLILKLLVIIIIGVFCASLLIKYFSNKAAPFFMSYAESETRKLTTLIINKAVTKQIANDFNEEDLFDIIKDNEGRVQIITYNSKNVTKILNSITSLVQLNLKAIEEGNIDLLELPDDTLNNYDSNLLEKGIIYEIPFGAISNSSLLSNVGPKIPVKFNLIGDVVSGIDTNIKEYGINNALLEVGVSINVTTRINLPFVSDEITVSTIIPISMKIIEGSIPNFYAGNIKSSFKIIENYNNI